jgi:hypothetical protein
MATAASGCEGLVHFGHATSTVLNTITEIAKAMAAKVT